MARLQCYQHINQSCSITNCLSVRAHLKAFCNAEDKVLDWLKILAPSSIAILNALEEDSSARYSK